MLEIREASAMPDYKRMYTLLRGAIDRELDTLQTIPLARASAERLSAALQKAEDIYIDTSPHIEETDGEKILVFHSPSPTLDDESRMAPDP